MRVLLTGVSGQVGGALLAPLSNWGTVHAPVRSDLDLGRPADIRPFLDDLSPDLIVNPAAYTAVDRAEDEPELAFRVNAESPRQMAEWAALHDVPLIHFSTDYVFDGSGKSAWREDSAAAPLSVYGRSKLAGEEAIRAAAAPSLTIRTSWVYASHGRNFVVTIARLAAERPELRVVCDQFGAPSSARAIAAAVTKIVAAGLPALRSRVRSCNTLHIACAGETSWFGFAEAIVDGLQRRGRDLMAKRVIPVGSDDYPTRAVRPRNSRLDLTRARDIFSIAMPTWQSALEIELAELCSEQST
jgi:dTDP-4-dehydrorhamnose reductase